MAKLKRLALSAVQHFIDSGHYPFWECAVGMRKPGSVCVVRWGAHRYRTQIITLLVVIHCSKSRIGLRLSSVDAQNTTHFSILACDLDSAFYLTYSANFLIALVIYILPYLPLIPCLSKHLPLTRSINNPIDNPSTHTPPSGNCKSTIPCSSQRSSTSCSKFNVTRSSQRTPSPHSNSTTSRPSRSSPLDNPKPVTSRSTQRSLTPCFKPNATRSSQRAQSSNSDSTTPRPPRRSPSINSKSTTPRSSQHSPPAFETYNSSLGSTSNSSTTTITIFTKSSICPLILFLAPICIHVPSTAPNQTFSNAIPESFGEEHARFLENSMTHHQPNILENPTPHRRTGLPPPLPPPAPANSSSSTQPPVPQFKKNQENSTPHRQTSLPPPLPPQRRTSPPPPLPPPTPPNPSTQPPAQFKIFQENSPKLSMNFITLDMSKLQRRPSLPFSPPPFSPNPSPNQSPITSYLPHLLDYSPKYSAQFPKALQLIKYFSEFYKPVLEHTILHGVIQHNYLRRSYFFSLQILHISYTYLFNFLKRSKYFTNCYTAEYITLHSELRYYYLRCSFCSVYTLSVYLFYSKSFKYLPKFFKPAIEHITLRCLINYFNLQFYCLSFCTTHILPSYLLNSSTLVNIFAHNLCKLATDLISLYDIVHHLYLPNLFQHFKQFLTKHHQTNIHLNTPLPFIFFSLSTHLFKQNTLLHQQYTHFYHYLHSAYYPPLPYSLHSILLVAPFPTLSAETCRDHPTKISRHATTTVRHQSRNHRKPVRLPSLHIKPIPTLLPHCSSNIRLIYIVNLSYAMADQTLYPEGFRYSIRLPNMQETCICTDSTVAEIHNLPFLALYSQNRNGNIPHAIFSCPASQSNRQNTIDQVIDANKSETSQLRRDLNTSPSIRRRLTLLRMIHYISTVSFLTKKKGSYDQIRSLSLELRNLLAALTSGRDQMNRLIASHNDSQSYKLDQDLVKEAEVAEYIHTGEWTVHQSYKVLQTNPPYVIKPLSIKYLYFIHKLNCNFYYRYPRCSLAVIFQNSILNPRDTCYPQLGESTNLLHHPKHPQPTHVPTLPIHTSIQNWLISPPFLPQISNIKPYSTMHTILLYTPCNEQPISETTNLYLMTILLVNKPASTLHQYFLFFRLKMSTHPSPLTTFLDEFQQILIEISKSFPDTREFRRLYKNLNRLIACVRLELTQLDKIRNIMRTNSPPPIKLAKMYEEISILIVQVNYSTFKHILTLKQALTFIFNKLVLSKIILLSYYMYCYNINNLNLISKPRTRRKTQTWKPVKFMYPSSAPPTLTSNQCTAVHRNTFMLSTCSNHHLLHSSLTFLNEPPSACTTVRMLSTTLILPNHLLKSYTNLLPIFNNINNIYAKLHAFKKSSLLIILKCPNCRIQRSNSTNTLEPSCSLQPPSTSPQTQVAKINFHRCLCAIFQPFSNIRYPAYLLQQHFLLYTTSPSPYNLNYAIPLYMLIQLHYKSHNLCIQILSCTCAVPQYALNQLHYIHSISFFFRHRMADRNKAAILQEYLQELEDRFTEIQQFNIPPTPTFLNFHRSLIQLINQVRKEMLYLLEMLTLMADPSVPTPDKLNSMYHVMAKIIEVNNWTTHLNLSKCTTTFSTHNYFVISPTLTTILPLNHSYLPFKQNFKNLKINYINCLRTRKLWPMSRPDPTRSHSWMTPFHSPTLPHPPLNLYILAKFLARLPYVFAYPQLKFSHNFAYRFPQNLSSAIISEIYLPWRK